MSYTRTVTDFPATSWTLKLTLAGPKVLTVTAATSGTDFVVTLSATQTAALEAGAYVYVERVESGVERYDVERGAVTVTADPTLAGPGDLQSKEEKMLVVVEAAIDGTLASGMQSYQILGRAVSKIPIRELMELRSQLKAAIAARKSGSISRPILIRFTPPGMNQ